MEWLVDFRFWTSQRGCLSHRCYTQLPINKFKCQCGGNHPRCLPIAGPAVGPGVHFQPRAHGQDLESVPWPHACFPMFYKLYHSKNTTRSIILESAARQRMGWIWYQKDLLLMSADGITMPNVKELCTELHPCCGLKGSQWTKLYR